MKKGFWSDFSSTVCRSGKDGSLVGWMLVVGLVSIPLTTPFLTTKTSEVFVTLKYGAIFIISFILSFALGRWLSGRLPYDAGL